MEIKNKLTVTGGEVGGDNRGKREGSSRNMHKGHRDKAKRGARIEGGRWGWVGWGVWWGENVDNCT